MTTATLPTVAALEAERAALPGQLHDAAHAGSAADLRRLQRRREDLPTELALARAEEQRAAIATIDRLLAEVDRELADPEQATRVAALLATAERTKADALAAEQTWRQAAQRGAAAIRRRQDLQQQRRDAERTLDALVEAIAPAATGGST